LSATEQATGCILVERIVVLGWGMDRLSQDERNRTGGGRNHWKKWPGTNFVMRRTFLYFVKGAGFILQDRLVTRDSLDGYNDTWSPYPWVW